MKAHRLAVAQRGVPFSGRLLARGTFTPPERLRVIEGFELILDGAFAHMPLKRARYGFDPIQRLRILRTQVDELSDDAFHFELVDILTQLRDAHTLYYGPSKIENKVAVLPFLVDMVRPMTPRQRQAGKTKADRAPIYIVTKVLAHSRLDSAFKPGVVIEWWNGVPIDQAVQRYSDREVGGRADTQRARATQSLTNRWMQYGLPPDEHWVIVGYRSTTASGTVTGPVREIKIDWRVVDPSEIAPKLVAGPSARGAVASRRKRAVNLAAAAVRRAKELLYAPAALMGTQPAVPKPAQTTRRLKPLPAEVIPSPLSDTLKATVISVPGGPFGYIRIWAFETEPDPFVRELQRLIRRLPDRGLIIDVRDNPGGYICAAEEALQLFTPNRIEPTRFSVLATPLTRELASRRSLREDLGAWRPSLEAAVRNGELYSQSIPLTSFEDCNTIGQQYGGPVVLVGDATTYSAADMFAAGFVDNRRAVCLRR
jgi:hypothetical protein